MQGTIKSFDRVRGFGFVTTADRDVFLHHTALRRSRIDDVSIGDWR